MTGPGNPIEGCWDEDFSAELEEDYASYFGDEPDVVSDATHWPSIPAAEAASQWMGLSDWVNRLLLRFAHLDHHVVPHCWWRHNEYVEALCALRDHERTCYSAHAPGTAPVEWFRALRDITGQLRAWTAELACAATHQDTAARPAPPADQEWDGFVHADVRRRQETAHGLSGEGGCDSTATADDPDAGTTEATTADGSES